MVLPNPSNPLSGYGPTTYTSVCLCVCICLSECISISMCMCERTTRTVLRMHMSLHVCTNI